MTTANLTQDECAARAATVALESYLIDLNLLSAPDQASATFTSTTTIRFTATPGADTWVDLIADSITSATLNGDNLDVSAYDGARLPVPGLAEHNELVVVAQPVYSRTGEGLHRFTDPLDGNTYLYSHFEPTDARRVFACFEQPDLKARFTVQVTAPADWVVRSGQSEVERDEVVQHGSRCATVKFAPSSPMSTYIVAVAAGPFHVEQDEWEITRADGTSQTVPLMLLCRRTMAEHLEAEDVLEVTKQGLSYYDEKYQFPYPWGKYDQIFVPEYNLGAMENPGLVTFTENYLARGRSTAQLRERRTAVIMHEMAHMWFGNLATMRWWDGLWLKESFADLMGYHVCAAATQYDTSWVSFALGRKAGAYRADQLPSTHPIVASVADLEEARQNFDGITYNKGASVIKQLMAYVGEDTFFAGAAAYFERHAYGSTELTDLLACVEESSGRDLGGWARAWLQTSGLSTLTPSVELDAERRITRLDIRQDSIDAVTGATVERPHRLRVGLYTLVEDGLRRTRTLELDLTGDRTDVADAVGEVADLVLVNDDDLTYAKVRFDPRSLETVRHHLSTLESPVSRGLAWSSLWNATRDGVLSASDFLDTVHSQIRAETVPLIAAHTLQNARTAIHTYLPANARGSAVRRLLDLLHEGLASAPANSDLQLIWARALAIGAGDAPDGVPAARDLLAETPPAPGLEVDQDLRWSALAALAAQDAATGEELEQELQRDPSMSGHRSRIRAEAGRPTAAAKREAWERITGGGLTNDELRALIAGFTCPSGDALIGEYASVYYESLLEWWTEQTQTMATIMATGLFPGGPLERGQTPEEHQDVIAADTWLEAHPTAPATLRRIVVEARDDLVRALRAQAN